MSIELMESKLKGGLPGEFALMAQEKRYGQLKINFYAWYQIALTHNRVDELNACVSITTIPEEYIEVTDLFGLDRFLNNIDKGFHLIPWKYYVICAIV